VTAAITVVGEFAVFAGYSSMNEYMVLGMHRAGASVSVHPHYLSLSTCAPELIRLFADSPARIDGPVVYSSWPRPDLACYAGTDLFIRSMFESSRLPVGHAAMLNAARALIVPTTFVADTYRSSGVLSPLEIVPDGVDPAAYPYLRRPTRPGLTTLVVSAVYNRLYNLPGLADRKHLPEAIAGWQQAFADDPQARLLLKCRWGRREDFPDDPRITLIAEEEGTRGIAHWYQQADVLLALGSEGFGLPLIEGMATGLPVIALASEGQLDVCRDAAGLVLAVPPARWEPHLHEGKEPCGVRGVPSAADVAARLQWVAGHRDEAAEMGRAASEWVHKHRNVWNYGPAVLDVIRKYSRSRDHRSWRRAPGRPRSRSAGVGLASASQTGTGARSSPGGMPARTGAETRTSETALRRNRR
jgi:glycosyltransferase involved in cell wall biosynthesis